MAGHPLRPATRRRLGEPLPHQQADRPRVHPRPKNFPPQIMRSKVLSGISSDFSGLSQSPGQVTHVLLTRSPLIQGASSPSSFDLHVLSTPPAFVLSQDQTLRECFRDIPANTSQERNHRRNDPMVHSVLAVFFLQRNLVREGRGINISGVDFWHAVEFSRNGRFL